MPRVMRRTPESEKAAAYGYGGLLKDIVGRTVRETREGFRRDPTRLSGEEMIELALSGLGGGITGKLPKVTKLITKPIRDFHRTFREGLQARVGEMLGKIGAYDQWKFTAGDKIKSKRTGKVYEITSKAWNRRKNEPTYQYRRVAKEGEERGQFIAERAHENFTLMAGPRKIQKSAEELLMERFSREGLKYDAFTEPLPGYGYHQWTLYGEGPAKGATFGTKTTSLEEMEKKIADLMRSFSK